MPSRWFAGGKGLDDFRERMIKGGVNYFLWDRGQWFSRCLQPMESSSATRSAICSDEPDRVQNCGGQIDPLGSAAPNGDSALG